MVVDYLVVGAGLTGATFARALQDAGREVLIIDRRPHPGGNVHDHVHERSGIRIHTYGPHYFRTNSDDLWDYALRFGSFYKYEASLKSYVDGSFENWPIAESYIRKATGASWPVGFSGAPKNFEDASLAMMPTLIYEKFVKGYTEKQWGVPAKKLSAELAKRFDVRSDNEPRLVRHKHQGLPIEGYSAWINKMLEGIEYGHVDYLQERDSLRARRTLVFTGPIDEFFGFELGHLKYRGQLRKSEFYPSLNFWQPCAQVNYPSTAFQKIRTIEWKHMLQPSTNVRGTVVTTETPFTPTDPDQYEYPFPDKENAGLHQRYAARAKTLSNVLFAGRLGEYRYYDMDQAIARARMLAARLIEDSR